MIFLCNLLRCCRSVLMVWSPPPSVSSPASCGGKSNGLVFTKALLSRSSHRRLRIGSESGSFEAFRKAGEGAAEGRAAGKWGILLCVNVAGV